MLGNRRDHEVSDDLRHGILRAHLNNTRATSMRDRENIAEVEIMREDDKTVISCVRQYLAISRSWIAENRPVLRLDTTCLEIFNPVGAEVHVDRESHDDEIGTSNSSDRHAA